MGFKHRYSYILDSNPFIGSCLHIIIGFYSRKYYLLLIAFLIYETIDFIMNEDPRGNELGLFIDLFEFSYGYFMIDLFSKKNN